MRVINHIIFQLLLAYTVMAGSILHPFRRSSVDHATLDDHALRIAALELSVSQILVQLNADGRRPSLQRRPEIRRSSRSDTSVSSLRRLHSDQSPSIRSHDGYLSPPEV